MKRMLLASMIAALLLAGPAIAGNGHGNDKGKGQKGHKGGHDGHHAMVVPAPQRGPQWKADGRHDNGLHLGQKKQAWARGERISRTYLAPQYYVQDYSTYRLAPPPRGMVWVQPYEEDRRFYLVQVATGLISQILGR